MTPPLHLLSGHLQDEVKRWRKRPPCKTLRAQSAAEEEKEKGVCIQDELVHKPEGSVACKCYEHTECNGTESHECKRHCRKDLCKCCSI